MIKTFYLIYPIFIIFFIKFCKKNKIFIDFKKENHKRFVSKISNYSIAGIIFYIFWIYIHLFENTFQLNFFVSFSLIFLIGLFSDIKIFESARLRFLLQIMVLLYFVFVSDFTIPLSKINILDFFFSNNLFNKFFTIFCLMILINGNNFVDGLNTLLLGYNISLSCFLLFFFSRELHQPDVLLNYLIILLILLLFNIKGKIILGDSGSYALAFFLGIFLINFARNNPYLSPFFIISLVWYPCFELLFSMIRRINVGKKNYNPDTNHLHQLLYALVIKKIKKSEYAHIIVSLIINTYFISSLFLNYIAGYKTSIISIFLIVNISVYMIVHRYLLKNS